ncbi:MAG: TlyA family rRNA (cytidine-2'-O)-methyltransferase [Anaerolineaceae bacterium]|nr:TlyA family rRNA (cytidine-2'-O)-methyltransferase [Anaerolineaceae bacterium]
MSTKQRIDILMFERGLAPSREKARAMIMAGEVLVDSQPVSKPGTSVDVNAEIIVKNKPRFVSRGGEKLAWAIETFGINVTEKICADVGASTGGFTDCLLQNGAARVYAIDVGYGQIDYALRQNKRVIVIERTNARYLENLAETVNFVTVDASFISLKILLPTIKNWLQPSSDLVLLIKPQFEAGREEVGKGGVVRDSKIHKRVLIDLLDAFDQMGFCIMGLTTSPIKGPAGNTEFLTWLHFGDQLDSVPDIHTLVTSVLNVDL